MNYIDGDGLPPVHTYSESALSIYTVRGDHGGWRRPLRLSWTVSQATGGEVAFYYDEGLLDSFNVAMAEEGGVVGGHRGSIGGVMPERPSAQEQAAIRRVINLPTA